MKSCWRCSCKTDELRASIRRRVASVVEKEIVLQPLAGNTCVLLEVLHAVLAQHLLIDQEAAGEVEWFLSKRASAGSDK